MAEVVGVEPTSTVLETAILPLNYTSIIADCSNIIAYKIINVKKKINICLNLFKLYKK